METLVYDPDKHRRRSIRLPAYDYSRAGAYFVTVCTKDRACSLGQMVNGQIRLNDAGRIAERAWVDLRSRFAGVETDALVVMPNHLHGVLMIDSGTRRGGAMNCAPTLGEIVRAFKATTARRIRKGGCAHFAWQRNYYEYVVRDEADLERIREYIAMNPARWAEDQENPDRRGAQP